ncbi:hypothetical protein RF11_13756 [Thelohanellus kitauei]|uniref:Uncharacterized protein n=1 Tax=Thelohanellus kitauei TaxID=669202 RepID=A0A0C2NAV4_THEKT|nr:hypothetical protein RF11_13756 [Thelohanellus kitauei]
MNNGQEWVNEAEKYAIEDYIQNTTLSDLYTQKLAVRAFMSRFSHRYNPRADLSFVKHFPKELFEEFCKMSDDVTNMDKYQELATFFLEVFTFIFRNLDLNSDEKAQTFIGLFLKLIKTDQKIMTTNINTLIDSVMICVSYKSNKLLFIHENGMFHFYHLFIICNTHLKSRFLEMTEYAYTFYRDDNSSLSIVKLTENINEIIFDLMRKFNSDLTWFLFTVLKMIYRCRLLDEIDLCCTQFFRITKFEYILNFNINDLVFDISYVSKIWISILNSSRKSFEIDTMEKLIVMSAIFTYYISKMMADCYNKSVKFVLTKKIKQMFYVIYLTLVAYHTINHHEYDWFADVLKILYEKIQIYFKKYSIEDYTVEDQFLFIQHLIKSMSTLDLDTKTSNIKIIKGSLGRILTYPSLSNRL